MTEEGFQKLMRSEELTEGEKKYIKDCQFRMGCSFTCALFDAIARADIVNRERLRLGFPSEVQGYEAWTEGTLYERASKIAGGDAHAIIPTNRYAENPDGNI